MGCGASSVPNEEAEKEAALQLEEMKKKREEAEKKLREEEEADKERMKEEAKRRALEEAEAARVKAEQEATEEAARVKAEKEAEAARLKAEQEAAEEAARLKAEQEEREKREKEEAERHNLVVNKVILTVADDTEENVCQEISHDIVLCVKEQAEDEARREDVQEVVDSLYDVVEDRIAEEEEVARLAERARIAAEEAQAVLMSKVQSVKVGWLLKQGHVIRNWKKRWFVLDKGVLRYYVKPLDEEPFGDGLKGEMILENYVVIHSGGKSFELRTYEDDQTNDQEQKKPGLIRRLSMRRGSSATKIKCESTIFEAEDDATALDWIEIIKIHIDHYFKTNYEKSEAVQKIFMEGQLEVKGIKWNQRWCCVKLNKFEYFADKAMTESKGFVNIIPKETIVLERDFVKKFKFAVTNGRETLELAAVSKDEMRKWAAVITRVGAREIGSEYDEKYEEFACNFQKEDDTLDNSGDNKVQEDIPDVTAVASDVVFEIEGRQDSQMDRPQQVLRNDENEVVGTDEKTDVVEVTEVTIEVDKGDQHQQNKSGEQANEIEDNDESILSQKDDTLTSIQKEISDLFAISSRDKNYDEEKLQTLLDSIDSNPLYKAIDRIEWEQYRESVRSFTDQCLETQRSFVPPHIFGSSLESLVDNDNLRKVLATRFMMHKATWLVRVSKTDFSRMHHTELTGSFCLHKPSIVFHMFHCLGRFNPLTQGLDIIELGAIFGNLPDSFENDFFGKKKLWKRRIEEFFKESYAKYQSEKMSEYRKRSGAYKNQEPLFSRDTTMHSFNLKIEKSRRTSHNSLADNDRRSALEKANSKPLLPTKAFL